MSHANAYTNKLSLSPNSLPASVPASANAARRGQTPMRLLTIRPASTSNGVIYQNGTQHTPAPAPISTPVPDAYIPDTNTALPHSVSAQFVARHPWLQLTNLEDIKRSISVAMASYLVSNLITDIQGLLQAHIWTVNNYLAKPQPTFQDIEDVCTHAQQTAYIIQNKQQHLGVNHSSLQALINKTVAELQNMPNSYSLSEYTDKIAQYFAQLDTLLPGKLQKSQEATIIDTSKIEGLRNITPVHQGILAWMVWHQCHPNAQTHNLRITTKPLLILRMMLSKTFSIF